MNSISSAARSSAFAVSIAPLLLVSACADNLALGQRRADSVDGYIDRRGVQRARIVTTTRGAMDATGQDETGWAHDRRVDVQLGS